MTNTTLANMDRDLLAEVIEFLDDLREHANPVTGLSDIRDITGLSKADAMSLFIIWTDTFDMSIGSMSRYENAYALFDKLLSEKS